MSDVPEYQRTLKTGEPQLLVCPLNPTPDLPSDAAESTTSWIGVPLVTRGTIIGLLTLAAASCEAFAAPHLAVAAAIGDYVALAIQNSRLYEETKEAASRDPLTGAFSRYWFLPFAEREIARAQREHSPLSVVVYDLDHFKTVKDHFGHPAGDSVLSTLTRTFTKRLRTSDPLCRFGGEEFAVLLPGSDAAIARRVAERLCEQAAALRHECCEGRAVTISAGVASLGGAITTYDELIRGADRALYRAKNAGRNRVVVETDRT